jgi:hypothetical protein
LVVSLSWRMKTPKKVFLDMWVPATFFNSLQSSACGHNAMMGLTLK